MSAPGHYLSAPHVAAPQGHDVTDNPGNIGGHAVSEYNDVSPVRVRWSLASDHAVFSDILHDGGNFKLFVCNSRNPHHFQSRQDRLKRFCNHYNHEASVLFWSTFKVSCQFPLFPHGVYWNCQNLACKCLLCICCSDVRWGNAVIVTET